MITPIVFKDELFMKNKRSCNNSVSGHYNLFTSVNIFIINI